MRKTHFFVCYKSNKFDITWQAFFIDGAEMREFTRISRDIIAFFSGNLAIKSTAFMQMELKFELWGSKKQKKSQKATGNYFQGEERDRCPRSFSPLG